MTRRKRDRNPQTARRPSAAPDDELRPDPWRPWLLGGLGALFVLRPLIPSESAALRGDGLTVVMLWIALAVLWLLGVIGRRGFQVRFGWTDAAVVLLVVLHAIAAVWATTRASPRPALNMLWEWVAFGLGFLLARQLVVGRREAKALIAVMIGLAVALAGYGLYQYYHELPETRDEYFRDPDKVLREAGMWFPPGSRERELFETRVYDIHPLGTFALTNSLAGYLAPWLVLTAGIGVSAGLSRRRWRTWLAVVACGLPVAFCLYLTRSRSALAATALGLLLVAMFCRGRPIRISRKVQVAAAVSGALLVAAVVILSSLGIGVLSEASKSLGYRIQYWQSTLRLIADHPIAGCGPGNFQETYTRYMLPEASEEIADPHNFLMEVWATAGTPAALALLAVLAGFAFALLRYGRLDRAQKRRTDASVPGAEQSGAKEDEAPGRRFAQPPGTSAAGADASLYVLGGAVCGFLLSVPIGQMSSAPPTVAELLPGLRMVVAVVLGLPLAAAAVVILLRWVDEGPLVAALPAIGLVVLLVNLLAAGGIGYPGVAGSVWLLMALALNLTETSRPHRLPRSAALAGLAGMLTLAIACSASAFRPVLGSQAKMDLARWDLRGAQEHLKQRNVPLAQRDLLQAQRHLKDAALADPLSAEPWKLLASVAFDRWLSDLTSEAFEDFESCMQTAVELAPNSAATWRMWGDRYWHAYGETGQVDLARKAVAVYRRAVDLYPNSGATRASLALALRAAGDESGFRKEAARALWLDEMTPHADKKLAPARRDELRKGLPRNGSRDNGRGILETG